MNFQGLMNAILRAEGKSDFGALECLKEALVDHFKESGAPQVADRIEALMNRICDGIEDF